jgi:hypothetical protein
MRYLFGFLCVCALVGTLPLRASAQDTEADTASEQNLQEPAPSSERAPEEPALRLKLDAAGVEVVPSPPRTFDGYTIEEMNLRVKRARIGLLSTVGVTAAGVVLFGAGAARSRSSEDLDVLSRKNGALLISGMSLMISGAVGMIASGIVLGLSKAELRSLQEADYRRPRRVQWDLARSRLLF